VGDERITPHDADELSRCFAAHARELFGYACVLVRDDRARAEDLVQATFEAAGRSWRALRGLTQEQRRLWLRSTLAHAAASDFRREAALRDRLPRIEARHRKTPADPPEQAVSPITLERCWQIILQMPERQHAVALLRWKLDMKEAEIAAVLGVAEKTVHAQLHRVRRKLIAQLVPDDPFTRDDSEGASS
jgi:RNA polymerase sigma-70 factor (ECF subfamily)